MGCVRLTCLLKSPFIKIGTSIKNSFKCFLNRKNKLLALNRWYNCKGYFHVLEKTE